MTAMQHVTQVTRAVESASASALTASWRRSMITHALNPAERHRPDRLTGAELGQRRAQAGLMLDVADPLLDHLFSLIGTSGCGVFLSDRDGVVVDQRCGDGDAAAFQDWNLWSGAHWGEAFEGTNGIGTCVAEGRRVVIHRTEHFALRNTGMSCIDAPIHGPEGRIEGALDISSARADQSAPLNRLLSEAVGQTARQIEAGLFREAYRGSRILVADGDGAALLAVDADDVVVGANRAARRRFGLRAEGPLPPCPAVDLLDDAPARRGFDRGEYAAMKRALLRHGGNASAAARELGIGRATFYRKLKKHGLDA